jgi:hypothetical protein
MSTREETELKLRKLQITQDRLEREILSIANYDCLTLKEARRKIDEIEKAGAKTLIFCGIKCLSVRDKDGNEWPFIPLWYPLYASIGDFFNPPVDEPLFDAMKKARWQNLRLWFCMRGNENEDGYAQTETAIAIVNKNLEQYCQNEREIEDTELLLKEIISRSARKPEDAEKTNALTEELREGNEAYVKIYEALMRGKSGEIITVIQGPPKLLNLKFSIASIGRLFQSYSNNKRISQFVRASDEKTDSGVLKAAKSNYKILKPKDWDRVNKILRFD